MEENQLKNVLELHRKWINKEPGGERADLCGANLQGANLRRAGLQEADLCGANLCGADLCGANLQRADLREANLRGANLQRADLREANLREANLDYSCWPLWCGSLDVRVCKRIAAQLAYHFCRLDCDDPEVIAAQNAIIPLANQFHRADECGKLEPKEVK